MKYLATGSNNRGQLHPRAVVVIVCKQSSCEWEIDMRWIGFRWIAGLVFALLVFTTQTFAQSPAPLTNPNVQLLVYGKVNAVAHLPDGSVVFGGEFISVNGTPRGNIAKLRTDGTLDPDWNPSANGDISALAVDGSGNVYAGGAFGMIGGQSRSCIAKLSGGGTGAADVNWNPSASSAPLALAVDSSGNVYAGGAFTTIGGQARSFIAKLSGSSGVVDANWDPSAHYGDVDALAVDASGNVYAGGNFQKIGGQNRNNIAKLSGSGTGAADANWNPSPNDYVHALAVDTSGNVYAGGTFTYISGQFRSHIAKLSGSGTGAADANWNPSADDAVSTLVVDSSGSVYAGGYFHKVGGQYRSFIAKLSGSGTGDADANWDPSAQSNVTTNAYVYALAVDVSGDVYAGGAFSTIGGQPHAGFAVLSGTGMASAGADTGQEGGVVDAVVTQPNGGVIVGGSFRYPRANILRLQADGTLDPNWDPSPDYNVFALAVDSSGNVYAGGNFTTIGGQSRSHIAKLSGSGTGAADANWDPSAGSNTYSPDVNALAVDSSGNVYAGGYFSTIGGQSRNHIAKLSGTGSGDADINWNPSADNPVFALAVGGSGSGSVYAGGSFFNIGGQSRNFVAKLSDSGNGSADANWNPSAENSVLALAVDGSGNVYAAGYFFTIGGQSRNGIAKLSGSGTGAVDANWNPSPQSPSGYPYMTALALDGRGNIYAGGIFTAIGGQSGNNIARLSTSGTGAADANWNPSALYGTGGQVDALALGGSCNVYAGGFFDTVGGQRRLSLAALPDGDWIFCNGFE